MFIRRRNRLILMFMWDTGCRLDEVAKVSIQDLHETEAWGYFHGLYTKRNKGRPFILDEDLYSDLKAFIADQKRKLGLTGTDTIFHNVEGKPMNRKSVYNLIKTLVKRAELN
jgi:site-specific recombinase XerD